MGRQVTYLTDEHNRPLFDALGLERVVTDPEAIGRDSRPTHLVAVERAGRAADGRYYNMRAVDITAYTAPLDQLFIDAPGMGIHTIAIGDGGNEIGMGCIHADVQRHIPFGGRIASTVATAELIVAGVSNWGAFGLAAALSLLEGRDLLIGSAEARSDIRRLVQAGAVDGVSQRRESTIDGLPLDKSLAVLEAVRACIGQ